MAGLFVCRHVERHVVGAGEQIIERDQFHAKVGRHLLRNERIVGDDAHSECRRAARDLLPNPSEAGEPQRLVADLFAEKLLLLPLSLFHGGVSRRQVPGHREHQTHCELCHAHAVRARRIHHDDATCACRWNVTLSTPVPARAITFSCGAAAIRAAVTFVALRTTSAAASVRSAAS